MLESKQMNKKIFKTILCFFPLLFLAFFMEGCCPHRFMPKGTPEPLPSFYIPKRIKVALVLGSGGVRGMAHVGVLEELTAAGIPVDIIVGCSAGSIVGALYADNPDVQALKTAVWKIKSDSLLDISLWDCRFGLSQGRTLHRVLDEHLEAETFDDLKIPLIVVASDLHSGELVPMGSGDLVMAVKASCSIPFFFVPCDYKGRIFVDGGVVDPVPVKVASDLGAEIIIAVDLCELLPRTFPTNLFSVAARSAEIAFMWQNQRCTKNAHVTIRPKTCDIGTFNDKMKNQLYIAGKRAARQQLPKIKELLRAASQNSCQDDTGWREINLECYHPQIYQEH